MSSDRQPNRPDNTAASEPFEFGKEKINGEDWTVIAARANYSPGPGGVLPTYTAEAGEHVKAIGVKVDAADGSFVIAGQASSVTAEKGSHVKGLGGEITAKDGSEVDAQAKGYVNADGGHIVASNGARVWARGSANVDAGQGAIVHVDSKDVVVHAHKGSLVSGEFRDREAASIDAERGARLLNLDEQTNIQAPAGTDITLSSEHNSYLSVPKGAVHTTGESDSEKSILAQPGSTVTATEGFDVVARKDSKVDAQSGSVVVATPGSFVTAEYGATVLAVPGSNIDRKPGANVIDVQAARYAGAQFDDRISSETLGTRWVTDRAQANTLTYSWRDGDRAPGGTFGVAHWGNVIAGAGSHVTAEYGYGNGSVTAENNSDVLAKTGAKVDAKGGSRVTAEAYSHVTAEPGSNVTAKSDADITVQNGANMSYEDGSAKRWMKDHYMGWLTGESASEKERREQWERRQRQDNTVLGAPAG